MRGLTLAGALIGLAIAGQARAQSMPAMPAHPTADPTAVAIASTTMNGEHESAPVYYFVRTNRLDYGPSQAGQRLSWDIDARIGTDEHRLVLKSEGQALKGLTKEADLQLLYSRPISEFFDVQAGVRRLFGPTDRNYFALGVQGTAPYFFDTEATLFVSDKGQVSARLKADLDLAWTSTIYSRPSVELNAYGSDDRAAETYAGIGSVKFALQTRYQLSKQVAPYLEIGWERLLGQTGQQAERGGERAENAYAVLGVRLMY